MRRPRYDRPMGKAYLALITDERHGRIDEERVVLEPLGFELRVASCATAEEVGKACAEADAVLVNMAPVNATAISAMQRCRVISRYGVGIDNIDAKAAAARGIAVANVPGYCDAEVAEHAMALLLHLMRGLGQRDSAIRNGKWGWRAAHASLRGATVGVAGFGATGRAFCRMALAHAPQRLVVWSRSLTQEKLEAELGALASMTGTELASVGFEELFAQSDMLSLHLALCDQTRALVSKKVLSVAKPGLYLVNTARGGLVDQVALAESLESGRLGGAGLDVFALEPPDPSDPIFKAPNTVFSNHSAYLSERSLSELKTRCAQNAARAMGLL